MSFVDKKQEKRLDNGTRLSCEEGSMRFLVLLLLALGISPTFAEQTAGRSNSDGVSKQSAVKPVTGYARGTLDLAFFGDRYRVWTFTEGTTECQIRVELGESFDKVIELANLCRQTASRI